MKKLWSFKPKLQQNFPEIHLKNEFQLFVIQVIYVIEISQKLGNSLRLSFPFQLASFEPPWSVRWKLFVTIGIFQTMCLLFNKEWKLSQRYRVHTYNFEHFVWFNDRKQSSTSGRYCLLQNLHILPVFCFERNCYSHGCFPFVLNNPKW